jgi:hypothetical protein
MALLLIVVIHNKKLVGQKREKHFMCFSRWSLLIKQKEKFICWMLKNLEL